MIEEELKKKGYEDKVFYVWFDAPIGYIGITKQWADQNPETRNWKDWWYDAKDVRHIEFMGKDNVPYHSITFPATLLGTGENWTQVDYLKGVSYLTFEGGKFSKSENRGIFAEDAIKEFPSDYWRYWLMSNIPEGSDTSFTFDSFAGVINKDSPSSALPTLHIPSDVIGVKQNTKGDVIFTALCRQGRQILTEFSKRLHRLGFGKILDNQSVEIMEFFVTGKGIVNSITAQEHRSGEILIQTLLIPITEFLIGIFIRQRGSDIKETFIIPGNGLNHLSPFVGNNTLAVTDLNTKAPIFSAYKAYQRCAVNGRQFFSGKIAVKHLYCRQMPGDGSSFHTVVPQEIEEIEQYLPVGILPPADFILLQKSGKGGEVAAVSGDGICAQSPLNGHKLDEISQKGIHQSFRESNALHGETFSAVFSMRQEQFWLLRLHPHSGHKP